MTQLTPDALSCYWYGALSRYGELYFAEETPAQKKEKELENAENKGEEAKP